MNRPEAAIQRKIAAFLSKHLPEDAWFTAVAHGQRLDDDGDIAWTRAVMAKDMGTKSGVPDLLLLWRGRAYLGEVKAPTGSLTAAQRHTIPLIAAAGCPVAVWRSVDDARASLVAWEIPVRGEPLSTERIRRGFNAARDAVLLERAEWPASEELGWRRRRAKT